MHKAILPITGLLCALVLLTGCSEWKWSRWAVNGRLTGTTYCNAGNVSECLGTVSDGIYTAPNGKVFKEGCTPGVARALISAQPAMARLKSVIGYADEAMEAVRPESALSNLMVDTIMDAAEEITGRKVDLGLCNFGGIRMSIPEGDVLMDDIVSMFPFKNYLCHVTLKGSDVRALVEGMVDKPQVLGGVRLVVRDGKVETLEVGGAPLDDEKVYGLATIDFLLDGGDGISAARNALDLVITDKLIIDVMLPRMMGFAEEGKNVGYFTDGRVTYIESERK